MNRVLTITGDMLKDVPRRSGDEPFREGNLKEYVKCSPQERG